MLTGNQNKRKYIVNRSTLQLGDIILTSDKTALSKTVRKFTNGDYSHAMLWVGGTVIHADGDGVYSTNLDRILFSEPERVKILRCKDEIPLSQRLLLTNFARSEVGKRYALKEAISVKTGFKRSLTDLQFCSRLVAQAYRYINIHLVNDSDFCSPEDLNRSELLKPIENFLNLATIEQIEFSETDNPVKKIQNDTMQMLEKIRNDYDKNINTIEGIILHLEAHPEHDEKITTIALESGYFNHAEFDINKNPCRYSESEFINYCNGDIALMRYLSNFIRHLGDSSQHTHETELNKYKNLYSQKPLHFYKESIRLYKQLVNSHYLRIAVADQIDTLISRSISQ